MPFESHRMRIMADLRRWGEEVSAAGVYSKRPQETVSTPACAPSDSYNSTPLTVESAIVDGNGNTTGPVSDNDTVQDLAEPRVPSLEDAESSASPLGLNRQTHDAHSTPNASVNVLANMVSTKDWTLQQLLSRGRNFHAAERVSASSNTLVETIRKYEEEGIPLVIQDFHQHPKWSQSVFTLDEFTKGTSPDITVRNVHTRADTTIPLKDFISKCRTSSVYEEDGETERLYGKDAECPQIWENCLQDGIVPKVLLSKKSEDMLRYLPENGAVETLMCYLGIGDTYTPCHKDLCASSGQNIMCYTERDGSSFWFMTESSSAPAVSQYFKEKLGRELDHENYVVSIEELANAPFNIYVVQQQLGDMVLVPPRSCHQVINTGGITVKASWSRMTLKGLSVAYHYELPIYHRVCRPETYRVKSTIYHVLDSLTKKVKSIRARQSKPLRSGRASTPPKNPLIDSRLASLIDDIRYVLPLYELVLYEEYEPDSKIRSNVVSDTSNGAFVCDFCLGDIFQSFFECDTCSDMENGPCHLCPGCYVEGRNCKCGGMKPVQSGDFQRLVKVRNEAIQAVISCSGNGHGHTDDHSWELADKIPVGARPLFRAACALYKLQRHGKGKGTERVCSGHDCSHLAPKSWTIKCGHCGVTKCFYHILCDYSIYSADALLLHSTGENDNLYHEYHNNAKKMFSREELALGDACVRGEPPRSSGYHPLVAVAMQYTRCRPAKNKVVTQGWYDNPLAAIMRAALDILPSEPASVIPPVDSLSVQQSLASNTVARKTCTPESSSRKRKRQMYVLVPQAPYNIKSATQIPSQPSSTCSDLYTIPSLQEKEIVVQSVAPSVEKETSSNIQNQDDGTTSEVNRRPRKRLATMAPSHSSLGPVPDASSPSAVRVIKSIKNLKFKKMVITEKPQSSEDTGNLPIPALGPTPVATETSSLATEPSSSPATEPSSMATGTSSLPSEIAQPPFQPPQAAQAVPQTPLLPSNATLIVVADRIMLSHLLSSATSKPQIEQGPRPPYYDVPGGYNTHTPPPWRTQPPQPPPTSSYYQGYNDRFPAQPYPPNVQNVENHHHYYHDPYSHPQWGVFNRGYAPYPNQGRYPNHTPNYPNYPNPNAYRHSAPRPGPSSFGPKTSNRAFEKHAWGRDGHREDMDYINHPAGPQDRTPGTSEAVFQVRHKVRAKERWYMEEEAAERDAMMAKERDMAFRSDTTAFEFPTAYTPSDPSHFQQKNAASLSSSGTTNWQGGLPLTARTAKQSSTTDSVKTPRHSHDHPPDVDARARVQRNTSIPESRPGRLGAEARRSRGLPLMATNGASRGRSRSPAPAPPPQPHRNTSIPQSRRPGAGAEAPRSRGSPLTSNGTPRGRSRSPARPPQLQRNTSGHRSTDTRTANQSSSASNNSLSARLPTSSGMGASSRLPQNTLREGAPQHTDTTMETEPDANQSSSATNITSLPPSQPSRDVDIPLPSSSTGNQQDTMPQICEQPAPSNAEDETMDDDWEINYEQDEATDVFPRQFSKVYEVQGPVDDDYNIHDNPWNQPAV